MTATTSSSTSDVFPYVSGEVMTTSSIDPSTWSRYSTGGSTTKTSEDYGSEDPSSVTVIALTMDDTQKSMKSDIEKVAAATPLKVGYEKPRLLCLSYKTVSNLVGLALLVCLVGETHYICTNLNVDIEKVILEWNVQDHKQSFMISFGMYLIIIAIILAFQHVLMTLLRSTLTTAAVTFGVSVLTSTCLYMSEKYIYSSYQGRLLDAYSTNSFDYEKLHHLKVSLFVHTANFILSIVGLLVSIVALFTEYKASQYAIVY